MLDRNWTWETTTLKGMARCAHDCSKLQHEIFAGGDKLEED